MTQQNKGAISLPQHHRSPLQERNKNTISIKEMQEQFAGDARRLNQPDQPTVGKFPYEIFPTTLQRIIEQTGTHCLYKTDWISSAILYATSVAVGNCYGAKYGTYKQKAVIYLAIVGMSGTNKSGPLEFAVKPFREIEKGAYYKYKQLKEEYDHWFTLSKKERKDEGLPDHLALPTYQTFLVSDVTQESLIQTHQQNPIGIGLLMDELAAWLNNFTRYNKGSEEQFWLSAWSFSPIKSCRKTAGVQQIDTPFISLAGTIQPGVLDSLAKDGRSQNGFIDRILFTFPDEQQKVKDANSQMDDDIEEKYSLFIHKLLSLRDKITTDNYGSINIQWLPFAPNALDRMRAWRDANTDRINQTDDNALKGICAKFDAYCIRFALLIELMDWACDEADLSRIRLTSVERAILLTDYFWQNAVKVQYILTEQTPAERLPRDQQRLYNGLPDELSKADAVDIASRMMPPISSRTVSRLLQNGSVFRIVKRGQYEKKC